MASLTFSAASESLAEADAVLLHGQLQIGDNHQIGVVPLAHHSAGQYKVQYGGVGGAGLDFQKGVGLLGSGDVLSLL